MAFAQALCRNGLGVAAALILGMLSSACWAVARPMQADPDPGVDASGAVHMPPVTVPFSGFASSAAKAAFMAQVEEAQLRARYP